MNSALEEMIAWLACVIAANYDPKKCGLKEYFTTLGHVVLVATLLAACTSILIVSLYKHAAFPSNFQLFAMFSAIPLSVLLILAVFNLFYIVAAFPKPASPSGSIVSMILPILAVIGTGFLLVGLFGVSIILFIDLVSARFAHQ